MKKKGIKILSIILAVFVVLGISGFLANTVTFYSLKKYVNTFEQVMYEDKLAPTYNSDLECYTFKTERDFKVLQLTDVHIGGGFMSTKKDKKAINAVASMITAEKPDLVIITGDLVFPVPYMAGTFNNKNPHKIITTLMENLGVYYTVVFGNHDTEAYNYYDREAVGKFYEDKSINSEFLLFSRGPENIKGECNHYINIVNNQNVITQTLYMIDSNAYLDDDPLGLKWHYDNVNQNQIDWYKEKVLMMHEANKVALNNDNAPMPKSMIFQHIPIKEVKDAFNESYDEESKTFKNTENVTYNFGKVGEDSPYVFPPEDSLNYFDTILELGSSQAMFFGHDHLNNFSLTYKGFTFTYGLSIDYLAYGADRGCTVITIKNDGSFTLKQESYYQDKYVVKEGIDKND